MIDIELLNQVDSLVKSRATYKADPPGQDDWNSYAKQILADPNFRFTGDCDDYAQTALHILFLKGVPKNRLYRALVASPSAQKTGIFADHFIGIVQMDDGQLYTIGDTFGPPTLVSKCPHIVRQTSRFDEGTLWRNWGVVKRPTNSTSMALKTSLAGRQAIKAHEGCRLLVYDDARPNYVLRAGDKPIGTLTGGYGHTGGLTFPQNLSQAQADAFFEQDLAKTELIVKHYTLVPLSQGQFDALVDFVFNVGETQFKTSTLLQYINAGRPSADILAQFRRWNRSNGQVYDGLVKRREDECRLWQSQAPVLETGAAPPGGVVEAAPLIEEHSAAKQSVTLWSHAIQLTGAASLILMNLPYDQILDATQQFKGIADQVGFHWLVTAIGGFMSIIAGLMFLRRLNQILGAKR